MNTYVRGFLTFLALISLCTTYGFSEEAVLAGNANGEQTARIRYLLQNKGFLNVEATEEISSLAGQFSEAGRFQLYEQYKMRPGFLLNPPVSRYSIFPQYEDTSLKVAMSILGVAGTASWFYVAMIGSQYDNGPVTTSIGLGGLSVSLTAAVYFLGLPIWDPRGYDVNTVNRELREVLNIKTNS